MIRLWDVEWANGITRTVAASTVEEAIKKAKKDFPSKSEITEVRLAAEEDEPEALILLPARPDGGSSH
jgi:hypothetical protein